MFEIVHSPNRSKKPNAAPTQLPDDFQRDLVNIFKLLSDETRLRVLMYLYSEGELHVSAMCDRLNQSQPAVSHHLALLRDAGLIGCRRDGKHNFYHLVPKRFQHFLDMLFAVHAGQPIRELCGARDERVHTREFCEDRRTFRRDSLKSR